MYFKYPKDTLVFRVYEVPGKWKRYKKPTDVKLAQNELITLQCDKRGQVNFNMYDDPCKTKNPVEARLIFCQPWCVISDTNLVEKLNAAAKLNLSFQVFVSKREYQELKEGGFKKILESLPRDTRSLLRMDDSGILVLLRTVYP